MKPYMKFQNPSFKIFLNGWTDAHTHARTDGQAEHFFKVRGIKMQIPGQKLIVFFSCFNPQ